MNVSNFTSELWRVIPAFPQYEVSNTGRVKSLRFGKSRILKPWVRKGYAYVALSRDGHMNKRPVHQLVLEAFRGPCPAGLEGCHENGIKSDNRINNLRWDTHKANVDDQRKHGTLKLRRGNTGVQSPKKLTAEQVIEIRSKFIPYRYPMPRLA